MLFINVNSMKTSQSAIKILKNNINIFKKEEKSCFFLLCTTLCDFVSNKAKQTARKHT